MSILIHDNSTEFRLEVRQTLNAPVAAELVRIFQTARSSIRATPVILDLRRVPQIDEAGHDAIDFLKTQGVICRNPAPAAEPTCWRTMLFGIWQALTGPAQPAMVPVPCRIRARFTRK